TGAVFLEPVFFARCPFSARNEGTERSTDMAGGMDLGTGRKGGKKALDTPINVVPFIDLMAVTISFLIMTAVWNQISRLQVSQEGGPSDSPPAKSSTVPIILLVTERGF